MSRAQASRVFIATFVGIGAWIILVKTGERLPYLVTPFSRDIRAMLMFPVLAAVLAWFAFAHRWKQTGKTGYAMRMAQLGSRKERVTQTMLALCGLLLVPAMIAWTSIHLVAWVAYLVSGSSFQEAYQIIDKKSVTGGLSLEMQSRSTNDEVSLRVRTQWGADLRSGMVVCAQGRSSVFGTVIESLNGSDCSSLSKEKDPAQPST